MVLDKAIRMGHHFLMKICFALVHDENASSKMFSFVATKLNFVRTFLDMKSLNNEVIYHNVA